MKTHKFAVLVAIAAALILIAVFLGMFGGLSTVSWFVTLGVLGGVVVASVLAISQFRPEDVIPEEDRNAGIQISRIPITGGIGAGLLILILLGGLIIDVPEIRYLALPGILGGLVFGVILIYRNR